MFHYNMSTFTGVEQSNGNLDVDTFAPTGLNIDQWLDAVVSAGGKYATLTTKHHDGFALWPTTYHVGENAPYSVAQTAWYAANGSPDIVSQFVAKCRTHNLLPCLYFSIWDKTYEIRAGTNETTDAAGYIAMVEAQLTELLTNYGSITAIFTDGWYWHMGYEEIPYATIADHVHTIQSNCLILENNHLHPSDGDIEIYETASDGSIPITNGDYADETNTIRIDGHWFYSVTDDHSAAALTAAATILAAVANANAHVGTYTLNACPGKDGLLPAAYVTRLGELGA